MTVSETRRCLWLGCWHAMFWYPEEGVWRCVAAHVSFAPGPLDEAPKGASA